MWGANRDELDVPLHDQEMLEEIDLVAELMAAAGSDAELDQRAIDGILGISADG